MNLARQEAFDVAEKRRHERKNLAYEQIPGTFQIRFGDKKIEFNQVNDVSISGMGILIDNHLPTKSQVSISYEADDLRISVQAEVVWQEKLSDDVYRMGLQFSNKDVDDNVMLFMTLREYIDEFGS